MLRGNIFVDICYFMCVQYILGVLFQTVFSSISIISTL